MLTRGYEPRDLFRLQYPGGAQVSPDGKYVAYVVQRLDEAQDKSFTDVYLYDVKAGRSGRLTNSGKDSNPRFSPDGRRLAFISNRGDKSQIYILELDGGEPWALPTAEAVEGAPVWFPDGQRIAYAARVFSKAEGWVPYPGAPAGDADRLKEMAAREHKPAEKTGSEKKPVEVKVISRFRYREDGDGYFGDSRRQVFATPVPDAPPTAKLEPLGRQITSGDFDHFGLTLSPDGKYLAVSARRTENADLENKSDLWLFEVDSGRAHLLYDGPGPVFSALWSPDGKYVAFAGHDNRHNVSTTEDLLTISVEAYTAALANGQEPEPLSAARALNLTGALDLPFGCYAPSDVRYRAGAHLCWMNGALYFLLSHRGAAGVFRVAPGGGVESVVDDDNRVISAIHGSNDVLVYTCSTPTQPEELYINMGGSEKPVTSLNAGVIAEVKASAWERFTYDSDDFHPVDGWVLYPDGFNAGRRYPLLLLIHGGPHGAYGPSFMLMGEIFAAKGYVVLYTNPRGSQSYGQHHACVIDKNWGDRDYADVMAGVNALVRRGFVDESRLFVHGWSYGGYLACWIITHTDRFKAACAGASVTNMLSCYGADDCTIDDEHEYGGTPWEDAEHLMRLSPLTYVQNVTTPVLLMHGEGDLRVPTEQTDEFYAALKRLGKTAYMVRYPGEFHGPSRPAHRLDRYERLLAWFQFYRGSQETGVRSQEGNASTGRP